ncbi:MAG: TonB-dependent receptor [Xanthomonadaceae bacterium]|nr:TonB-dependent receptor [Xanthomonadaceae bacterium]
MTLHLNRPCIAGLMLLAFAPLAHAEDAPLAARDLPRTLDTVVVEGQAEPGNFIIEREDIELTQPSDLADLLSNESGVAVGGGSPVSQKIYVRGFEDTMLNVTIDGAQEPAELYHHQSRVQIEPEFIESIELTAGAGAATNGPGALTGALRVRTRDAFDMLREGQKAGFLLKGGYGSQGDAGKGVASVYGLLGENIGVMASLVRQDGDDYEDGNGNRVSPTGFDHRRQQFKLSGRFTDNQMDFSYEDLKDTGTYYERPHMTDYAGRFVLSDHELHRRTATYTHHYDPASALVDVEATAFRTVSDFKVRRTTTGLMYAQGEQESIGVDLRNTMRWTGLDLVWGADFREDTLDALQQATPAAFWGSTRQRARVAGAYAQADWRPNEAWLVSGGLRYDAYTHRGLEGVSAGVRNKDSGLSPNLSVAWRPLDSLTLRAAYSQAFRGITIRESFFSALYTYPGDLKGERADNLELGVAWEHDGYFMRVTGFRQNIDHFISAVYNGGAVWGYWRNVGTAEVKGYEAELGKTWERFDVALGVWNSDGNLDGRALNDADLGLGTSIGRTWTLRGDWKPADGRSQYGLRARAVESEKNTISATAPDKPGYTVVDLLGRWTLIGDERLVLTASINNLFDRFYYDHGTYGYNAGAGKYIGFASPGREFNVSLTYRY